MYTTSRFPSFFRIRPHGGVFLLVIWVALLAAITPVHANFAGGDGSAQNPFLVSTLEQLQSIRGSSNSAHFRLINNIDASATAGWNNGQGFDPVGWFNGVFDGNGYTISNLTINRPSSSNVALFSTTGSGAILKNVRFHNASITGGARSAILVGTLAGSASNVRTNGNVTGSGIAGGVAAQMDGGSLTDCHANVVIQSGGSIVGGLLGYNNQGNVSNCTAAGTVSGQSNTGGLIGNNQGNVNNSHTNTQVNGSGNNVGGLVGFNNNGNIDNCHADGSVGGNSNVGGLIGLNGYAGSLISNSHSTATVSGQSNDIGGLIGHNNNGIIEGCYSTGGVSGTTNVGGLVGFSGYGSSVIRLSYSTSSVQPASGGGNRNQFGGLVGDLHSGTVENCFARGDVYGNNRVGGLIGQMTSSATVINSYSTGAVNPDAGQAGGLVGRNQGSSVTNSFWDTQTSGFSSSDGGTGRNTQQMKTQSTFANAGWDFNAIWGIQAGVNDGYPYLRLHFVVVVFEWTGAVNTAWALAGNWSMNRVPVPDDNVTIPNVSNKPRITGHVVIQGINILSGSSLTIAETGSLTVTGSLVNQAGTAGLQVISSAAGTGSLITHDGVEGSFGRFIGNAETWQLLSSPVENQPIGGEFTPPGSYGDGTGYDFFTWYEPDTAWIYLLNTQHPPTWATAHPESHFVAGRGYLVAYQQSGTKTFSGTFNHGTVSVPLTKSGGYAFDLESDAYSMFSMNLVGNPYPSSIDWKALSGWGRNTLVGGNANSDIWIWSESNKNYGVYNSGSTSNFGTLGTSRYIAPNQGFFVRATGNGDMTFTDAVRTHEGAGNWINKSGGVDGFVSVLSDGGGSGVLHLRVEESSGNGADEVIIEFGHAAAGNSPKLFSMIESAPSLYVPKENKTYSIRRLNSTVQTPVLPLCFEAGTDGEYLIRSSFLEEDWEMVVLEDLHTGIRHDLRSQGDYHFFATTADKPGRFLLRFTEGNFANPHLSLPVYAFAANHAVAIDLRLLDTNQHCRVAIYDSMGRELFNAFVNGNQLYHIPFDTYQGVVLVQISTRTSTYGTKVLLVP